MPCCHWEAAIHIDLSGTTHESARGSQDKQRFTVRLDTGRLHNPIPITLSSIRDKIKYIFSGLRSTDVLLSSPTHIGLSSTLLEI